MQVSYSISFFSFFSFGQFSSKMLVLVVVLALFHAMMKLFLKVRCHYVDLDLKYRSPQDECTFVDIYKVDMDGP